MKPSIKLVEPIKHHKLDKWVEKEKELLNIIKELEDKGHLQNIKYYEKMLEQLRECWEWNEEDLARERKKMAGAILKSDLTAQQKTKILKKLDLVPDDMEIIELKKKVFNAKDDTRNN